jgi:AraC family transcriptional regulator
MLRHSAVFLNQAGLGEIPMPRPEELREGWEVRSLSVVRSWSSQPLSYGNSGVLRNGFAITVSLTPTKRRTIVNGNLVFDGWAPAGATRIHRPGEHVATELLTGFDHIAIYIPANIFNTILHDRYDVDPGTFDIVDPLWRIDAVVESNLRCALSALEDKSTTSFIYLNAMARSLAEHVIYWHSNVAGKASAGRPPESAAMRRVAHFIDANIDKNLTLADLAAVAEQSPDQFRRAFKVFAEMSPHQYLIQRRVARACELMRSRARPRLSEIALECGFADQSHLSTTFRRVLGVSPARFQRRS